MGLGIAAARAFGIDSEFPSAGQRSSNPSNVQVMSADCERSAGVLPMYRFWQGSLGVIDGTRDSLSRRPVLVRVRMIRHHRQIRILIGR